MHIKIRKGVPQGGSLSPILFTLALDQLLRDNQSTREMIESGKLFAYADDLVLIIKPSELYKVQSLVMVLKEGGFDTNPSKCQYIGNSRNEYLEKFGRHSEFAKYLGVMM